MTNLNHVPSEQEDRMIARVSTVTILGNVLLSAVKLFAGIAGHSGAMVSDAVHSLSDVGTTAIAFLGVRLSRKEADREHPYGHERMECAASLILGTILFLVGFGIGWEGLTKITARAYDTLAVPGKIALAAAFLSILSKEAMYWYTRHYALLLDSAAFMADAWHHRSDALSSVGSLIGIGGAMLGFPVLDPVASLVICLCIFKVAFDTMKDAFDKMLDTSCGKEYESRLSAFITNQPDIVRLDSLRTRMFGSKVYVDLEIAMTGTKTLQEAHAVAERIHDAVEETFPSIKHIMIHVNPAD
ncbi:MAG: cation transporter [Clostridiaceae bacterium]|nr:cation transporter [Clostridiaceae bacterium]